MIDVDAIVVATSRGWVSRRAVALHRARLARFALVGASGVLVNTAVLSLLVELVGLNPLAAGGLATEAAILSNFALNDRWTFGGARRGVAWPWRALRYNLVAGGGLLISIGVLAALMQGPGLYYLFANVFAIGAGFLWNYTGSAWFASRSGRSSSMARRSPSPTGSGCPSSRSGIGSLP
jgi:putative flippase GtrA